MPLVLYNEINVFYRLGRVSACWKLQAPCKSCLSTPPEAAELRHGSELGSIEKVRSWTATV